MKPFLLFPAALLGSALAAQAPANLVEAFNRETKAINQLLAELKPEEALAKAEGLIPAQKPVFLTTDLNAISQSSTNYRGLAAIYKACGNAAAAAGDWNKGLDYYEKALAAAKEGRDLFKVNATAQAEAGVEKLKSGLAVTREQWDKMRPESIANQADYVKRKADLEALPKRSKEQEAQLKELQDVLPRLQGFIQTNDQKIKQFEAAIAQAQGALVTVQDMVKELDSAVQKAEADAKGLSDKIEAQKKEIETFNAELLKKNKRTKILGNKNWADAVMVGKANFQGKTPQDQANLLYRLLVLDPGNKAALKALDNVKQGRDPFFVEKGGSKSKKTPKK